MIRLENGTVVLDNKYRSSRTAYPRGNARLQCIANRAQVFQGFGTMTGEMEPLQIVKYEPSDHCGHHYDGTNDNPRVTSFFAYLHFNGTGGGTNFPLLESPANRQWCEFVDCSEPAPEGVTFKPIVGNALYWENLQKSGEAHPKALHAGMPVTSGQKIGLNIWTQKIAM